MTAGQMRAFGMEALTKGYAEQALAIAAALLVRDPGDSAALVLQAQALRVLRRYRDSETAARAAWAAAKDSGARYVAATALAQALSLQGQRGAAQYWLRQAVQVAPNPAAKAQALQDLRYVRAQNPLSLQLDLTLRPSDNVNGGARDPLFEYHGLPFVLSGDALALSGLAWGVGVQGRYALADKPSAQTALTFAASAQGVVLSTQAQSQAPEAANGDYALGQVELGLERRLSLGAGQFAGEVSVGQSWYGGADLADSLALRATLVRPMTGGTATYSAGVTRTERRDRPVASSTGIEAGVLLDKAGPRGDRWQGGLRLVRVLSEDIAVDHAEATLTLSWNGHRPVAGLDLGGSVSVRAADYAASPYTATGRQDLRWTARLTASVAGWSYLGFAPLLSLEVSRNNSNVALYDTESVGLGMSVISRF